MTGDPPTDRPADVPTDLPAVIAPPYDRKMLEALVCPVTQGPLHYDADRAELVSKSAGLAFPIRDGIPIMLLDEARRID
jgi:uncharacterized protein YbaR (Trm112 family)